MSNIFIGTSGWVYEDWWEKFYPENIKSEERLEYYSKHFETVEINATFYRLPSSKTFENWYKKTPEKFVFSLKLSSFITRISRLMGVEEPLSNFINHSKPLKEKLSVILVQLPGNFKKDLGRLENFLKLLPKIRFAFEFRHKTWLDQEVYTLLKKYKAGFVIQNSAQWPTEEVVTAGFVYLRFHGLGSLYGSNYTDEMLLDWAKKIRRWLKEDLDVYAYFNNDFNAYAAKNALRLKGLISKKT